MASRVLALVVMLFGPAQTATAGWPADGIDNVLKTPEFKDGLWGVLVVDAKSGSPLFEKNADSMFCPASVTKLFSVAAAFVELGADHRFSTPIHRRGTLDKEGVLRGDLILVASGDPSLGGRTGPHGALLYTDNDHSYAGGHLKSTLTGTDPTAGLDALARQVTEAGIRAIRGDVLIDDRLFDRAESTGSGPSRLSPILINDNLIDVVVTPAATAGAPANVRIVPETAFVTYDARVETAPEGTRAQLTVTPLGQRRFEVRGRVPVGVSPLVKVYEIEDPASFARALLIEAMRRRGVDVPASPLGENNGSALPAAKEIAGQPKVAEYVSPPFREYAKVILKVSHNLHASTLPLLIAAKYQERKLEDGLRREGRALAGLGVDLKAVSFGGGAGGSRADLVSPRAVVALLRAMAARSDFAAYESALPVLGRDGTLAKSVGPDSPVRGHVRAKTGTYWVSNELDGKGILTSKALAGYMETASGRPLVFAFFVNNVPMASLGPDAVDATEAAGRFLGRLCEAVYDDKPAAAPVGR